MTQNLGEINLRRRRRVGNPMHEFDQLPKPLRKWLSKAILPWSPASVRRVWNKSINYCKRISRYLPYLPTSRRKCAKNNLLVFDGLHR